jgi:hypothetical protein
MTSPFLWGHVTQLIAELRDLLHRVAQAAPFSVSWIVL